MNSESKVKVQVTRRFSASPERVFDAWLDDEKAGQFLFATPNGQMTRVEIDARVGGSYLIVDRREGVEVAHMGEYLELDRPRRLVFTLSVPKYSPDAARVIIEIVPLETGCALTLSQDNADPNFVKNNEAGWTAILDGLAATLGQ
jgi:uncharacterized protein YndB with AHSA1/START domain